MIPKHSRRIRLNPDDHTLAMGCYCADHIEALGIGRRSFLQFVILRTDERYLYNAVAVFQQVEVFRSASRIPFVLTTNGYCVSAKTF